MSDRRCQLCKRPLPADAFYDLDVSGAGGGGKLAATMLALRWMLADRMGLRVVVFCDESCADKYYGRPAGRPPLPEDA